MNLIFYIQKDYHNMERILLSKIMKYLEDTIFTGIKEEPELFPIFKLVSQLITNSSEYSIKDIADPIYENIIWEVVNYLR